ncbi:MAG: hypothetical protein EA340_05865 [Nitriliruptor sp.]|nr:MAG: hypothetical protein EA340_05865 [Nitriliruptor sp.]
MLIDVRTGWLLGVGVVLLVLAGLGVGLPAGVAGAQTQAERELSDAREALERIRTEAAEADREVSTREAALADAEERLAAIEAIVNDVAAEVERQRVVVRDAQRRLAEVEQDQVVLEAAFTDRVARLFKQGPDLTFEALLNAEAADEVIARTELLERVLTGDQVDIERLAAVETAVLAQRAIVVAEQQRLEAQLAEQEEILAEVEQLRRSRALAAADARQRARELAVQRDDLEAEEEELAALVERQQAAARRAEEERRQAAARRQANQAPAAAAPTSTGRTAGGYAWPMCAPVTSEYGPRWGRMHRGIDLGAPTGTPIRAIRAGTVIFAGWQGGYGQITLVDHGNGVVSAYAHQSRFAVGQGARVAQGQVIGYVGTTGNTTGAHLHLETRVGGTAVNPRQYLSGSPC